MFPGGQSVRPGLPGPCSGCKWTQRWSVDRAHEWLGIWVPGTCCVLLWKPSLWLPVHGRRAAQCHLTRNFPGHRSDPSPEGPAVGRLAQVTQEALTLKLGLGAREGRAGNWTCYQCCPPALRPLLPSVQHWPLIQPEIGIHKKTKVWLRLCGLWSKQASVDLGAHVWLDRDPEDPGEAVLLATDFAHGTRDAFRV